MICIHAIKPPYAVASLELAAVKEKVLRLDLDEEP